MELSDVKPYEKNAKKHPGSQIKALANIVMEVGWRQPVLVNQQGVIIVGHGRFITWQKYQSDLNPSWKGDKVGYSGIHKWVIKYNGNPSVCEHCGNDSAKKYEWANKDHKYKRILSDYMRLCTKCHRKYDYNFN